MQKIPFLSNTLFTCLGSYSIARIAGIPTHPYRRFILSPISRPSTDAYALHKLIIFLRSSTFLSELLLTLPKGIGVIKHSIWANE